MKCNGCGTDEASSVKTFSKKDEKGQYILDAKGYHYLVDVCNKCSGLKMSPDYMRDAAGQRVNVPDSVQGKYSYAIDAPITSNKQYSEHLKSKNLSQKG